MGDTINKIVFKTGSDKLTQEVPDSLFDFTMKDIDGHMISLSKFKKKKVIMIVNVASK